MPQLSMAWASARTRPYIMRAVIGCHPSELFQVGDEVRITIVKIARNSVRIGIQAPEEVSVQREEIAFEVPQPQSRSYEAGAA